MGTGGNQELAAIVPRSYCTRGIGDRQERNQLGAARVLARFVRCQILMLRVTRSRASSASRSRRSCSFLVKDSKRERYLPELPHFDGTLGVEIYEHGFLWSKAG